MFLQFRDNADFSSAILHSTQWGSCHPGPSCILAELWLALLSRQILLGHGREGFFGEIFNFFIHHMCALGHRSFQVPWPSFSQLQNEETWLSVKSAGSLGDSRARRKAQAGINRGRTKVGLEILNLLFRKAPNRHVDRSPSVTESPKASPAWASQPRCFESHFCAASGKGTVSGPLPGPQHAASAGNPGGRGASRGSRQPGPRGSPWPPRPRARRRSCAAQRDGWRDNRVRCRLSLAPPESRWIARFAADRHGTTKANSQPPVNSRALLTCGAFPPISSLWMQQNG
ncbi:hypothetical protein P7K49_012303 [Saguinus oedipus]|uniref:Uncharacterized protein n=1 Tax=Saguinus oedipus TaxID=9490 RepID=A0ABQ9VT21_SAGOE|nr:hypothetical protein P7K49_012303 [Saguinus oedipus]